MSRIQVFVSFDAERDHELYERLVAQSRTPDSGFTVSGGSRRSTSPDVENEAVRSRIREADQVIVLCSEHTESSIPVSAELRIAQEEGKPYFLVWGRREIMCTKPMGARSNDGMYGWTRQTLRDQMAYTLRQARSDATAEALRSTAGKGRPAREPAPQPLRRPSSQAESG
jgi:hypothetical protein